MSIEIIVLWVICGLIGAAIGGRKGINPAGAFLAGVFLGPFSVLMVFVSSKVKKCPKCAENVQKEAKVCKHCNHQFNR